MVAILAITMFNGGIINNNLLYNDDDIYIYMHMGAVRKPLFVSLCKPELDHIKVRKTLARERCKEAARKKCERGLLSELYCMFR